MKKLALALVAATASLTAGSAFAADLPARTYSKAPPPVIAPVANWTGCYISGGLGYSLFHQENVTYVEGPPRTAVTGQWDVGGRGWTGRAQGGCDYQLGMGGWNVVIGLFGDYDWTDVSGRRDRTVLQRWRH